jgi:6-phosphogluconate dehydrogenase
MLDNKKSSIGLIGLGVMGASLARNFASKDYQTSVFNRSFVHTEELTKPHPKNLTGFEHLEDFVNSLEFPRKVFVMVKSGQPVDDVILELLEYLNPEDIIIDCGNSNWNDTDRRQHELENKVNFIGCGVSGGSQGALKGPSIMPGGKKEIVEHILPYLKEIAAKDFHSAPCVTNIGLGASGHFVKMVHNGIEYGLMQAIAEIYDLLKSKEISQDKIRDAIGQLNQGNLQSYLLDITMDILETKTEDGKSLLKLVEGKAQSKGTGGWSVISAIELGVSVPNLSSALFARYSSMEEHITSFNPKSEKNSLNFELNDEFMDGLYKSLIISYFTSYMQGVNLIQKASDVYGWNIDIQEVLRVWEGGCIIRSQTISAIKSYLLSSSDEKFDVLNSMKLNMPSIKTVFADSIVPLNVTSSSMNYLVTMFIPELPTNLIQAQRDYFGEHTYIRKDTGEVTTGGWYKSNG